MSEPGRALPFQHSVRRNAAHAATSKVPAEAPPTRQKASTRLAAAVAARKRRKRQTPRQRKQSCFCPRPRTRTRTMLDPSSSEDTGEESDPQVVPSKPASSSAVKRSDSGGAAAAPGGARGRGTAGGEEEEEEERRRKDRERIQEEQERKIKLQIYVFVLRCIAYPFNAKQPTDMARRQQKVRQPVSGWRQLVHLVLRRCLWLHPQTGRQNSKEVPPNSKLIWEV